MTDQDLLTDNYFDCVDLSSGYHQIPIHEKSKDLFCIILPQGKFRYCVVPQGTSPSCNLFNIATDEEIRGKPGYFKNIDDILATAKTIDQLEQRMEKLLNTCRRKSMKHSLHKFCLGE